MPRDPVPLAFVNRTPTVQVPPGARVVPVQLFCPRVALNNQAVPPAPPDPATTTLLTITEAEAEVFVRVTELVAVRTL